MQKRLKDFEIGKVYEAADECEDCGSKLEVIIREIDESGDYGWLEWRCPECKESYDEIVGWELADESAIIFGMELYPILGRSNIGPCLICEKLIIGVPLILFPEGGDYEFDFCFECAYQKGLLKRLYVKGGKEKG